MPKRKWKNVGDKIYESGEWVIENQKTWLNPHKGWVIYRNRVFVADVRTLDAAKTRVEMELADTVPSQAKLTPMV